MKILIASLLVVLIFANIQPNIYHSVLYDDQVHKLVILPGKHKHALVKGIFADTFNSTGWGKLSLFAKEDSNVVNFAAGYLEGALTSKFIFQHFQNMKAAFFNNNIPEEMLEFYQQQFDYTWEQIKKNPDCPRWQTVHKIMKYVDGLLQGVNEFADVNQSLSLIEMLVLQGLGDSLELYVKFTKMDSESPNFAKFIEANMHCSALIKADVQSGELFMGHATWLYYAAMLRVYKFINFGTFNIEFSGYPGITVSSDDFYVIKEKKRKLFIAETTNGVYNTTILNLITPKSLLSWQRAQLANRLANNGMEWTSHFVFQNSGTYNDQFMIVDNTKIQFNDKGGEIQPGFLWIIEQMPGDYFAADVTDTFVSNGNYWGSYNIPYSQKIYDGLGTQQMYEKYGDKYSYNNTSRAQIFRRNQTDVHDIYHFAKLMRYNQFQSDPLSHGDPSQAIASRFDLYSDPKDQQLVGAIDCKITTRSRILNYGYSLLQSGPTHDDQIVFDWNNHPGNVHLSHPVKFDFDWVEYGPDY